VIDPVDWAAWTYSKVGHWGLAVLVVCVSLIVGLVWMRGVEKFQREHPADQPTGNTHETPLASVEQVERRLTSIDNNAYRALVAEIIHAFEPRAHIVVGGAVIGPDGARSIDIQVWSAARQTSGPVALDVIDRPDGLPVGVDAVDTAHSRRDDINATAMLICSNTGFDDAALSKAKRTKIGLISVVSRGDTRVTGRIVEQIYLRKIDPGGINVRYDGLTAADGDRLRAMTDVREGLKYQGAPVLQWVFMRVSLALLANTMSPSLMRDLKDDERITATFDFKTPTVFSAEGREVRLKRIAVEFRPKIQWLSQTVRLDATAAIYDYVRGKLRFAPGKQQYVIEGVNFETAVPIDAPPEAATNFGIGLQPGEVDVRLIMLQNAKPPEPPKGLERVFQELESRINPGDLELGISDKRTGASEPTL